MAFESKPDMGFLLIVCLYTILKVEISHGVHWALGRRDKKKKSALYVVGFLKNIHDLHFDIMAWLNNT